MTYSGPDLERARQAYADRDRSTSFSPLYDPLVPAALFRLQEREWAFCDLFRRAGIPTLAGLDIHEVGCGAAASLARFVGLGAEPDRLSGIDLMPERIATARRLLPQADLRSGSAHELPYPDGSFDVVAQLMLFSSILDAELQHAIAAEMLRVLRPGGVVLWYDAHRSKASADFAPVPVSRIAELFPGCRIDRRSVTLRWELLYRVVHRSRWAALALQMLPPLCSHTAAIIRRSPPVAASSP